MPKIGVMTSTMMEMAFSAPLARLLVSLLWHPPQDRDGLRCASLAPACAVNTFNRAETRRKPDGPAERAQSAAAGPALAPPDLRQHRRDHRQHASRPGKPTRGRGG